MDDINAAAREKSIRPGHPSTSHLWTEKAKRYFGTVELDPVRASLEFSRLATELIELFSSKPGRAISIKVDIAAQDADGFDEPTLRAVRENGRVLGVHGTFE